MAIPHYPYLLLKMLGSKLVLSLRGALKGYYDCDIEAVQLTTNTQQSNQRLEVVDFTNQMQHGDIEITLKKTGALQASKETPLKTIDLLIGDPSNTVTINAKLNQA